MLYERSRLLVPWFFPVFILLAFLVRPNYAWSMFFYVVGVPLALYLGWARLWRKGRYDDLGHPLLVLSLALVVWSLLSLVWGVDQPALKIQRYVGAGAATAAFLLIGAWSFRLNDRDHGYRIMRLMVFGAGVNALISIGIFADRHIIPHSFDFLSRGVRLTGWAETRHEILGSNIMAVAGIMAAHLAQVDREKWRRVACVCVLPLILLFILFTGSRGPLIGFAFALALLLFLSYRRTVLIYGSALIAVVALLFLLVGSLQHWAEAMLTRPSLRLEIWASAFDQILRRPLLGHGIANASVFTKDLIAFPHNIYLSVIYYSGIPGLVLLLALLGAGFRFAARVADAKRRHFLIALLSVPVVAGLTDVGQVVRPPSEIWLFFWLPILFVIGMSGPDAAGAPEKSPATGDPVPPQLPHAAR